MGATDGGFPMRNTAKFFLIIFIVTAAAFALSGCHDSRSGGDPVPETETVTPLPPPPPPPPSPPPPPPPSECNAANCPTGCCSETGVCYTGNTVEACGTGAATCNVCTEGQTCSNAVCGSTPPPPPPPPPQLKPAKTIRRLGATGAETESKTFTYDGPSGRLIGIVWNLAGTETTVSISYDLAAPIARVSISTAGAGVWANQEWRLDETGRIVNVFDRKLTTSPPTEAAWNFAYEGANALPSQWHLYMDVDGDRSIDDVDPSADILMTVDATYDPNGRIESYTLDTLPFGALPDIDWTFEKNAANDCIEQAIYTPAGAPGVEYDYTCTFDSAGRLEIMVADTAASSSVVSTFRYDASGNLVRREISTDADPATAEEVIEYTYENFPAAWYPPFVPIPYRDALWGLDGMDVNFFTLTPLM